MATKLKVVKTTVVEESPKKGKAAKAEAKAPAPKKFAGKNTGLGVREFQNQLIARNPKAKLTDPELAKAMRDEFPNAVAYTEEHVRGIRSAYNKGKHGNEAPASPIAEYDDDGKALPVWGEKAAERRAKQEAKAEPAAEPAKPKKLKKVKG